MTTQQPKTQVTTTTKEQSLAFGSTTTTEQSKEFGLTTMMQQENKQFTTTTTTEESNELGLITTTQQEKKQVARTMTEKSKLMTMMQQEKKQVTATTTEQSKEFGWICGESLGSHQRGQNNNKEASPVDGMASSMGCSQNKEENASSVECGKVVANKPTRTRKTTLSQGGGSNITNRQGSSNNNNNLLTQPTFFHADPLDHFQAMPTYLEVLICGMPRAWKRPGWSHHSKMRCNASRQPQKDFSNVVKHAFHLCGLPIHTFGDSLLRASFLFAFRPPVKPGNISKKADVDNLIKFVNDSLQGTIYKDDGQITTHDGAKKCFDLSHGGNGYVGLILEVLSEENE